MMLDPYDWINTALDILHRAHWYRYVQPISSQSGAVIEIAGQRLINFASNDYLGLAGDSRLQEAAIDAIQRWGVGATGSRLVSGHRDLHQQLETAIASLKQTEAALVFSSGYLANLGTISALVNQRDMIMSDRYNHSSLKNGALLSGATVLEYQHNNVTDLQTQLQQHRSQYRRCLIITDSVFSMDGDLCPLPDILDLAEQFSSMVLIDEAHATGVLGKTGAGSVEHFHCTGRKLIQIGTLSKALGSLGGYVAGSKSLIEFLKNRAPTWIYTTALTPGDTAAALAALQIIQASPQLRHQLWQNVSDLKQALQQQFPDLRLFPSDSPILCIQLPNPEVALTLAEQLKQAGIFAPAIRPPTVPTSRIRLTLMATHTLEHLEHLITVLGQIPC